MSGRAQMQEAPARHPLDLLFLTVLAFVITGAPVLLNQLGQPLAIAFCLTASCLIVIYCERAVPIVLLVSLLFQTMFERPAYKTKPKEIEKPEFIFER